MNLLNSGSPIGSFFFIKIQKAKYIIDGYYRLKYLTDIYKNPESKIVYNDGVFCEKTGSSKDIQVCNLRNNRWLYHYIQDNYPNTEDYEDKVERYRATESFGETYKALEKTRVPIYNHTARCSVEEFELKNHLIDHLWRDHEIPSIP
jgi:hypothetical protein